MANELLALETRLRAILAPYDGRLEWGTVYGVPVLRRPGATAHQWFAFVKPATKHVGFFLLPVHEHPELRATLSQDLRKRLTGQATFAFRRIEEPLLVELEALVARAFDVYLADAPATA